MASAAGRPRISGESLTGRGTREDILAAAAALFCTRGFAGTSTHALAGEAGIRQASLYHHFRSKQEILLALLIGTVKPSLEAAAVLAAHRELFVEARLWALCVSDVRLLSSGEHNIGALYLLPELEDPFFEPFHAQRDALQAHYRSLTEGCGGVSGDSSAEAGLVLALVESVILQRRRRVEFPEGQAEMIADAALRMLGVQAGRRRRAHEEGATALRLVERI